MRHSVFHIISSLEIGVNACKIMKFFSKLVKTGSGFVKMTLRWAMCSCLLEKYAAMLHILKLVRLVRGGRYRVLGL